MTEQLEFWKGVFGDQYTDRNDFDLDSFAKQQWGITRTEMNKEFLEGMPKQARILEIGCNRGMQLDKLYEMGYKNLWGIEINKKALAIARKSARYNVVEATAFDIPFKDNYFDVVFTSGVLIHIRPDDLPKAVAEIGRVTRKYIWGFEYFSINLQEINYRGHGNRLWKADFAKLVQKNLPGFRLIKEKKYKYVDNDNVDTMYLLAK
jgi:pseudaminic acid biosynthesis-associated methylase